MKTSMSGFPSVAQFQVFGIWRLLESTETLGSRFSQGLTVAPESREEVIWIWGRQRLCLLLVVNGEIYLLLCSYLVSWKRA